MKSRRLSIMQPYVFPYLGYFHLIEASDHIVFYDDVTFIKQGWINRNRILSQGKSQLFTIPLSKASSFELIKNIEIHPDLFNNWKRKFLRTVEQSYAKAPFSEQVMPLIRGTLDSGHTRISDLAIHSIVSVYEYLQKPLQYSRSSESEAASSEMNREERLFHITRKMGYDTYVNPAGGQELYTKESFHQHGIELLFVQSQFLPHRQFNHDFVPGLSIIDLLMFNEPDAMVEQFSAFDLL